MYPSQSHPGNPAQVSRSEHTDKDGGEPPSDGVKKGATTSRREELGTTKLAARGIYPQEWKLEQLHREDPAGNSFSPSLADLWQRWSERTLEEKGDEEGRAMWGRMRAMVWPECQQSEPAPKRPRIDAQEETQPLFQPLARNCLEQLKFAPPPAPAPTVASPSRLEIAFDAYLPRKHFRKSEPGLPDARFCLAKGEEVPRGTEVRRLLADLPDSVPLVFCVCSRSASIAFYSLADVNLPDIPIRTEA